VHKRGEEESGARRSPPATLESYDLITVCIQCAENRNTALGCYCHFILCDLATAAAEKERKKEHKSLIKLNSNNSLSTISVCDYKSVIVVVV
jgi:hypothetical protein